MNRKVKILLADASDDARALLQTALERSGHFEVVASTGDGTQVVELVQRHKPDLMVLDLILPGLDGLSILRRFQDGDRPEILVTSNFVRQEMVAEAGNLSKKDAAAAVNAVLDVIEAELKKGEKIQLTGFGSFEVKAREARECRNPKTGETVMAAAAKRPTFTAGKAFKDALN